MSREVDRRYSRVSKLTPEREAQLRSLTLAASGLLPGAHQVTIARFDATTGTPAVVISESAPVQEGNYVQRALEHVQMIKRVLGLEPTQPAEFLADPHVQTTSSGAVAVHLQQQYKGIVIFEATETVRFASNGALRETVGRSATVGQDTPVAPTLSIVEAVQKAAQHVAEPDADELGATDQFGEPLNPVRVDLTGFEPQVITAFANSPEAPTILGAGPFGEEIKANLIWLPLGDDLRLTWEVILTMPNFDGQFRTLVDAENGEILYSRNLVQSVAAQGNVFFPNGAGERQMTVFPLPLTAYQLDTPTEDIPTGFPDDWVGAEGTTGSNGVQAHLGDSGPPLQGAPQQGVLTFDPVNPDGDDQKVLNIFFYNWIMHDFFYLLGFTEAEGNFQRNNFGRGGTQGDPVDARAYGGAVQGSANMLTLAEGLSPIMKMGLVTSTNQHTAFDASVVFHELTHGVTNRLVGGPMNTRALEAPQSRGMGEGWSDYIACSILDTTVVAAWVVNNPRGIRQFPYDDDFPAHAENFGSLGTGRYTAEHAIGEIWCATLMEMNRRIGKTLGVQLVVDALKLSPATPSFLDMRDAILAALDNKLVANQLSASTHATARGGIWAAFAKFGMGPSARSNGAFLTGVVPDFNRPPDVVPEEPQPETPSSMRVEDAPNLTIPDNSQDGVATILSVQEVGRITRLIVSIEIEHSYIGDLQVSLTTPGGRTVVLHNRSGGSAVNLVQSYTSEDTPALAALTNEQAQGNWTLRVADLAGKDIGTLRRWQLELGLTPSLQVVYQEATPALTIPDNDLSGASSPIMITQSGTARSLKVSVDITHTYIGDLVVEVMTPSGRNAVLHDQSGGNQSNLITTYDSAAAPALAALAGEPIQGEWHLQVTDLAGKDVGKLNMWSVEINLADGANALDLYFQFPNEQTKGDFEIAFQRWLAQYQQSAAL
ncbi:MAG: M36 family metallopeptidase, partial [Candidatus Tectomicrobia bacterium]|nr:M36 family metallopeptidase [Candidatus Tectomicrobia bacterium]